jgi:hypothetical protein
MSGFYEGFFPYLTTQPQSMTHTTNYSFTQTIEDISKPGDDEYYTLDPNNYKTLITYSFHYNSERTFNLIIHSHHHITDGEGFDPIPSFFGQWLGGLLGTWEGQLDDIPTNQHYTDILNKDTIHHDLYDFDYHTFTKLNGEWFTPFNGEPILI